MTSLAIFYLLVPELMCVVEVGMQMSHSLTRNPKLNQPANQQVQL